MVGLNKSRHLPGLRQLIPGDIGHELCSFKALATESRFTHVATASTGGYPSHLPSSTAGVLGAGIFFRVRPHLDEQVVCPSNN
jgi:hypothetical protein